MSGSPHERKPDPPAPRQPPGVNDSKLGVLRMTIIDGLFLVHLEPFLRLKIHSLDEEDPVREVLVGPRFKWYEREYGGRYEIYGFRLGGCGS